MSADVSTVSAIGGILKTRYLGPIRDQFRHMRVLEELLEHNTEDIDGEKAVIPIRISGNPATGFRADYATLPDAGRQRIEKVSVFMSYLYGRVAFSGPAIARSASDKGAFARVMDDEMKRLVDDLRAVANVYNYGDGSGCLARVTNVSSLTVTVDRWSPLFVVGRKLDTYTAKASGTKHGDSCVITAIDKANLQFTCDQVTNVIATDYVFGEDSYGVCQMGLMGIADDGEFLTTHQGLSRSSYPVWNGKVLRNGGAARTMSEGLLVDAMSVLEEEGLPVNLIVGTIFQRNDLVKQLQEQRQFVNVEKKLKAGIRAVEINDVPFTWDRDCPPGYTFVGNTDVLEFYESAPLDWMKKDGNVLSRMADKDAYEATLHMYRELGCSQNNNWLRIEDVAENRPSVS